MSEASASGLDGAEDRQVEGDAPQVIIHLQGHTKYRAQSRFYIENINTYLTVTDPRKKSRRKEVDAIA